MDWYLKVLRQYADFSGRARRKEYWMYTLINFIVVLILIVLDVQLGLNFVPQSPYGILYSVYALATFLPSIAVLIRRLHDIGKSGWSMLISLIPLVGGIILIVWLAKDGDPRDNEYGPDPKAEGDLILS